MDGADADLVLGLGLRGAEAPHHPETFGGSFSAISKKKGGENRAEKVGS